MTQNSRSINFLQLANRQIGQENSVCYLQTNNRPCLSLIFCLLKFHISFGQDEQPDLVNTRKAAAARAASLLQCRKMPLLSLRGAEINTICDTMYQIMEMLAYSPLLLSSHFVSNWVIPTVIVHHLATRELRNNCCAEANILMNTLNRNTF